MLHTIVELYRRSDKPLLHREGFFDGSLTGISSNVQLVKHALDSGVLQDLEVDGECYLYEFDSDEILYKTITFSCQFHGRGFFPSISVLLDATNNTYKGQLPEAYYVAELDYLKTEPNPPKEIQRLEQVCRWIRFLSEIVDHQEDKHRYYNFVLFRENKETKSFNKYMLDTRFSIDSLAYPLDGLDRFEEILDKQDLHHWERRSVFRNSLAELLQKAPKQQRFDYILEHFNELRDLYDHNYEVYINGFSLEEFKSEVEESRLAYLDKINATLSDTQSKLFSIPAALATLGLIIRADSEPAKWAIFSATVVISVIMTMVIYGQFAPLAYLHTSIKDRFTRFEEKEGHVASVVDEARKFLFKRIRYTRGILWVGLFVSWGTVLLALNLVLSRIPGPAAPEPSPVLLETFHSGTFSHSSAYLHQK